MKVQAIVFLFCALSFCADVGAVHAQYVVPDVTGNGHDMTVYGDFDIVGGCTGCGLRFDHYTEYGSVPHDFAWEIDEFTVEGFLYWEGPGDPSPTQNYWTIADKFTNSHDSGRSWMIGVQDQTDRLFARVHYNASDGYVAAIDTDPLPRNEWLHVAFTVGGGAVRLFLNGAQKGFADFSGKTVNYASASQLLFGNTDNWASELYGAFDEFRFSDVARTSFPSSCESLQPDENTVALWRFDGPSAVDESSWGSIKAMFR